MGRWVLINDEECPGCGRTGDGGERQNGKCWRCNLPVRLDPERHGDLLRTLLIERDGLMTARADCVSMADREFERTYSRTRSAARPQIEAMLQRNAQDIADLEDEEEAA